MPTGNVDFFDGGSPIGDNSGSSDSPLLGTSATCTTTYVSSNTHVITTLYRADSNYQALPLWFVITQIVDHGKRFDGSGDERIGTEHHGHGRGMINHPRCWHLLALDGDRR